MTTIRHSSDSKYLILYLRLHHLYVCILRYYEAQVSIGEAIQGWVYWTWKVRIVFPSVLPHDPLVQSRLRMQMIGAIREGWKEAGFRKIQRTGCTLIFAPEADSFALIYDFMFFSLHDHGLHIVSYLYVDHNNASILQIEILVRCLYQRTTKYEKRLDRNKNGAGLASTAFDTQT